MTSQGDFGHFAFIVLGSPNRQSPVLNLSKSGGNTDQGSNCDERSERSDIHSPPHSVRDDSIERTSARSVGDMGGGNGTNIDEDEDIENLSDDNASDVDERMGKDDEGKNLLKF